MGVNSYLIVTEIGKLGFIIGFFDGYDNAKSKIDDIVESIWPLSYDQVILLLKRNSIASYSRNGNEGDNYRVLYGNTNGYFSTWMDKVDKEGFCIRTYINGRQNFSFVFEFDDYEEELDRLAEKFPFIDIVAN